MLGEDDPVSARRIGLLRASETRFERDDLDLRLRYRTSGQIDHTTGENVSRGRFLRQKPGGCEHDRKQ
jgi:hypothetical protein